MSSEYKNIAKDELRRTGSISSSTESMLTYSERNEISKMTSLVRPSSSIKIPQFEFEPIVYVDNPDAWMPKNPNYATFKVLLNVSVLMWFIIVLCQIYPKRDSEGKICLFFFGVAGLYASIISLEYLIRKHFTKELKEKRSKNIKAFCWLILLLFLSLSISIVFTREAGII